MNKKITNSQKQILDSDFSCKFMYQEVSPLPMLQKEFFDNFNSEY